MTAVRLEPAALPSRDKHSTTEPLRSLTMVLRLWPGYIIVNSVLEVTSRLSTYMCTYDIGTCMCVHFKGLNARLY